MTSVVFSAYPLVKLGTVASIQPGYPFESERFTNDPADIPLVKGENVQQGFIDWVAAKRWPSSQFDHLNNYVLEPGDVVVAMDRPWVQAGLKWAYIQPEDPKALLVQRVARLKARRGIDQTYLRCLISSAYFAAYVQPIVTGVNVPHISGKQIGDFPIPLPILQQQRKIAGVLSAYDDLIANNQRRIALLESMAEEIYREWFVRLRFPGYGAVKFHKGRPEAWSEGRLDDFVSFTMGQSPSSEFYNERGEGLPFHQGVGTYGERFPRHVVFCSEAGRMSRQGDILFSVRAPVGRLNIADRDLIIGRGLSALRHKAGKQSFLYYLLRVVFAKEDVIGNGSIFNSVSKEDLARFPVLLPDDALVNRFEQLAAPIDGELALLYRKSEQLRTMRDALLPRLISGKLRVDHLDIRFPPSMQDAA